MRFSHVSGAPLLDLVNTIHWRLDPEQRSDDLTTYADVLDWCVESSLVSDTEARDLHQYAAANPKLASVEHHEVIRVREATYAAMFEGSPQALEDLTEGHLDASAQASLEIRDHTVAWADHELTLASPRHRIVREMVDLLTSSDLTRLHQCEDRACGWVYFDTSPRRNRRWCVSSDCGDRNRARAYYARNKSTPAR